MKKGVSEMENLKAIYVIVFAHPASQYYWEDFCEERADCTLYYAVVDGSTRFAADSFFLVTALAEAELYLPAVCGWKCVPVALPAAPRAAYYFW
jgi:hypothetical protein